LDKSVELNNEYKATLNVNLSLQNEFKIWDKKNNRWGNSNHFVISPDGKLYAIKIVLRGYQFVKKFTHIVELDPNDYIVCRYIGLSYEEQDAMNNTYAYKIYEGDILQGIDELHNKKIFGYVDFDMGSFTIKNAISTHYRWMDYDVKRIGNIYEDTTLMQKLEDDEYDISDPDMGYNICNDFKDKDKDIESDGCFGCSKLKDCTY
jgi:hypothetical protein